MTTPIKMSGKLKVGNKTYDLDEVVRVAKDIRRQKLANAKIAKHPHHKTSQKGHGNWARGGAVKTTGAPDYTPLEDAKGKSKAEKKPSPKKQKPKVSPKAKSKPSAEKPVKRPTSGGVPVADIAPTELFRDEWDSLVEVMGVPEYTSSAASDAQGKLGRGADEDGNPIIFEWDRPVKYGPWEHKNERPMEHLYRAVSEVDWQRIQEQGFIDTHGEWNLDPDEGLNSASEISTFYLPVVGAGRILRIDYNPDDGWKVDPRDEYVKTQEQVPTSRISLVSPVIEGRITEKPHAMAEEYPSFEGRWYRDTARFVLGPNEKPTSDELLATWGDLRSAYGDDYLGGYTPGEEDEVSKRSVVKHYGPGPHKSGTPQTVHGAWARGLSSSQVAEELRTTPGFTIHYPTGVKPRKGWSVSLGKWERTVKLADLTEAWVQKVKRDFEVPLRRDDTSLGGWVEPDDDGVDEAWLEVSKPVESFKAAVKLARSSNQIAIFNLGTGEYLYMSNKDRIAELMAEEGASVDVAARAPVVGYTRRRSATIVKPMTTNTISKHAATGAGGNHPSGSPQSVHGSSGGGTGSRHSEDPAAEAKQRPDGLWVPVIGGTPRAEIFDTENGAIKSAKRYIHNNWHRPEDDPSGYAPPIPTCDKCLAAAKITKHAATGAGGTHPGTGTSQDVHGHGGTGAANANKELTANLSDEVLGITETSHDAPTWFTGREAPPGHYWVSDTRLADIEQKLGTMNRRAAKHGLDPFTHEVVDTHEQLVNWADLVGGDTDAGATVESWSLVKVTGTPPKFEGWEFAGRIEHLPTVESGGEDMFNILHMRPDFEGDMPNQYRDSGPNCDACHRNVYRKDTFLVHNTDTDEWKQVGRDDLKLFTGSRNPAADQFYLKFWDDMEGDADDFFTGSGEGRAYIGSTEGYLTKVAAEVREHGYVSKSSLSDDRGHRIEDGRMTTSEIVQDPSYYVGKHTDDTPRITDGDIQLATDAREFYASYEPPAGVEEWKAYQKKWREVNPDFRSWESPDLEPPTVDQHSPGSHHWREGGGSEDYEQQVQEWITEVHNSPFDPTRDAKIVQKEVDGVMVTAIEHNSSATNKRIRDFYKDQSNDDFMLNMKAAAMTPHATTSNAGLMAYVIPGYQKHLAAVKLEAVKAAQPKSSWVGAPKKREVFSNMTIEMVRTGEGTYGPWTLTKLRTPEGNSITTWYGGDGLFVPDSGAEPRYEGEKPTRLWAAGDVITAKATVKEHTVDAYADDEKTTVIQRLAGVVLEEEA